jgi:hypothetical protein
MNNFTLLSNTNYKEGGETAMMPSRRLQGDISMER